MSSKGLTTMHTSRKRVSQFRDYNLNCHAQYSLPHNTAHFSKSSFKFSKIKQLAQINYAYSTVFLSVPISGLKLTSTTSPGFKNCGSFMAYPTPAHVPVINTVPFLSVVP